MNRLTTLAAASLLGIGLAACSGGDGGGQPITPGIDGVGFAVGPITGFGSIFVNGVEFSTASAQIRVDGGVAQESELQVGQVVSVRGTISADGRTGTASEVSYNENVLGPVSGVDVATGTLVVLGQTVRVTGSTIFDSGFAVKSLEGIAVDDVVEVSGFPNGSGEIVATRIEPKPGVSEFELFGVISNLSGATQLFSITTTLVNYAAAQIDDGPLANGRCAEVKGSAFAGGVFTATRIEVKSCGLMAEDGDRGEIEGVITRFVSATDFSIGAIPVTTDGSTTFEGGTSADLRLNLEIQVEGAFNANGVLVARKIEIERESSAGVLGTIDSLDTAMGTFSIFGVTITTDSGTSYQDESQAEVRRFGFADLRTGDYLKVRGFEGAAPRSMTATLVERDDLEARRELQGRASDVAQPDFRLIGVPVTTNAGTEFREEDRTITAQEFFLRAPGSEVEVRGTWNGATFTATRAKLDD